MVSTLLLFFFFFFVLLASTSASNALYLRSNASHILLSPSLDSLSVSHLSSPPFLEDVVRAIAEKERWDPHGEVRLSELDADSARVGSSQRYELRVRVAKAVLVLKLYDEAVSWRRTGPGTAEFWSDLVAGGGVGSRPSVRPLVLEGPLDLLVDSGDDELSLYLSALNITHKGLRRVLVGEGITVKIEGAEEVSLFHPYNIGPLLNQSVVADSGDRSQFLPFGYDICAPLLSVRVVGSASVVALNTRSAEAYVQTTLRSYDTVELFPDKCYHQGHFKQTQSCSFCSLDSRLALVEKALKNLLGYRVFQNRSSRFVKAKISSSTLVKFRLELERDLTENDRIWKKVAEWRTKPTVERVWFEIVARVDGGRRLKAVVVKKLKGPHIVVDSTAWSNLMSNISFTEFASIVVLPEALTLDVKW